MHPELQNLLALQDDDEAVRAIEAEMASLNPRIQSLDKARYVAAFLVGGADLVEDSTLRGVDIEVRIGNSYAGIRDKPIGLVGPKLADNDDAAAHPCNGAPDPGLDTRTAAAAK